LLPTLGLGVEDLGIVGKVVANDQIDVPIPIEVGLGGSVRVPALVRLNKLDGNKAFPSQLYGAS
jgi:hypothetical protein